MNPMQKHRKGYPEMNIKKENRVKASWLLVFSCMVFSVVGTPVQKNEKNKTPSKTNGKKNVSQSKCWLSTILAELTHEMNHNSHLTKNIATALYKILEHDKKLLNKQSIKRKLSHIFKKHYGKTPDKVKLGFVAHLEKQLKRLQRKYKHQCSQKKLSVNNESQVYGDKFSLLAKALERYHESAENCEHYKAAYNKILNEKGTIEMQKLAVGALKKSWENHETAVFELNTLCRTLDLQGSFKIDERKKRSMEGLFYMYESA